MVNYSTNINKMNYHLSSYLTDRLIIFNYISYSILLLWFSVSQYLVEED
jgi:hypothetical protein